MLLHATPHTHTHCDLCTNSLNQDGLDGLESSSIGMGFSTTHSLSVPYVSAAATNMPRVSPYVSSLNSTETFSDLVRRLLTSQIGCPRTATRRCRGGPSCYARICCETYKRRPHPTAAPMRGEAPDGIRELAEQSDQ